MEITSAHVVSVYFLPVHDYATYITALKTIFFMFSSASLICPVLIPFGILAGHTKVPCLHLNKPTTWE